MKCVELFAGAGGLAMGVSNAGFETDVVLERDFWACETIRQNQALGNFVVKKWKVQQQDVREFDYAALHKEITLVAGGPPCQPFSLGGKHAAYNDSRDMFPEAVRAVRTLQPRAFIFENVKGICRESFKSYFSYIYLRLSYPEMLHKTNETWEEHLSRLEKYHTKNNPEGLYYRVVARQVNAADFGIPQKRDRVFFVGFRCDQNTGWCFPAETHSQDRLLYDKWVSGEYWERLEIPKKQRVAPSPIVQKSLPRLKDAPPSDRAPWRTLRQALFGLPSPTERENVKIANHRLVPGAKSYPGHTGSPIDEPCKALKAGVHGVPGGENTILFPNGEIRYLTAREAARVQAFPDDYVFAGSWTESMRQIGNAVPVDLAMIVARSVWHSLSTKKSAS